MEHGGFRSLLAWQKAYALTLHVYRATSAFPADEKYGISSQMRRAAVSVAANIAEGYNRSHRGEYVQFLGIARGSAGELETYLLLARDLSYLNEAEYSTLNNLLLDSIRLLSALARSLTPPLQQN